MQQAQVLISSQYIKDFSLEIPNAPTIFKELKTQPKINVNMDISHSKLEDKYYEVSLKTTINSDLEDKKFFIVELVYSAVVLIDVPEDKLLEVVNVVIPQQLFPFVRSSIASIMMDSGLPPLMLTPIDFVGIFNKKNKKH